MATEKEKEKIPVLGMSFNQKCKGLETQENKSFSPKDFTLIKPTVFQPPILQSEIHGYGVWRKGATNAAVTLEEEWVIH